MLGDMLAGIIYIYIYIYNASERAPVLLRD